MLVLYFSVSLLQGLLSQLVFFLCLSYVSSVNTPSYSCCLLRFLQNPCFLVSYLFGDRSSCILANFIIRHGNSLPSLLNLPSMSNRVPIFTTIAALSAKLCSQDRTDFYPHALNSTPIIA